MGTDTKPLALGLASVARTLDVSRRTVHRLIEQGELPTLKIGRRRLVAVQALQAFVDAKAVPTPRVDPT